MKPKPLTLLTSVDGAEHPLLVEVAHQLSAMVAPIAGTDWPIDLTFDESEGHVGTVSIRIASVLADARGEESLAAIDRRWMAQVDRWLGAGHRRILLLTLFRHAAGGAASRIERLRRLNMMTIRLSRVKRIEIVDIDRLFAWFGARALATDYRCRGRAATTLAAQAVAAAILNGNLGDLLPSGVQEQAIERLRNLSIPHPGDMVDPHDL